MLDNYDSFTYNLVQYLEMLGQEIMVVKNDALEPEDIHALRPDALVVSPGPCGPREAGNSVAVIRQLAGRIPILGVCLGHQSIACAFGGEIVVNYRPMHGKISPVIHDRQTLFAGLPNPFEAVRYHSLVVDPGSLPACLEVSAWTEEGEIMGIRHRNGGVEGVQFHPESILTRQGLALLKNFIKSIPANPGQTEGMA